MFRQILKGNNVRKVRIAALLSFFIFIARTPVCVSAEETGLRDILEERGTYSCLSAKEVELLDLVNRYRESNGLPAIPNSRSLNKVARAHVQDLQVNRPADGKDIHGEQCNLHSWSYNGFWTPVCYTSGGRQPEAMWYKAKEITSYVYSGPVYENAYWASVEDNIPMRALNAWKKSPKHNVLMLEAAEWKGENFQAIGVAVYKGFAVIWVGKDTDTLGPMEACKVLANNTH